MKKFYLSLLLLFVATMNGICGTFTETSPHKYNYSGIVEPKDVETLVNLKSVNRELEITVNSRGGAYVAGLELGAFTKAKGIRIVVDQAYSAAGLWALGDHHMKFLNKDSILLLHLPYMPNETFVTSQPELWMRDGYFLGLYLTDVVGWNSHKTMAVMDKLTELRAMYGVNAGLVFKSDGKMYLLVPPTPAPEPSSPLLSLLAFPGAVVRARPT